MRSSQTLLLRLILIQPVAFVLYAETNIGAEEPKIRYIGRFNVATPAAPEIDWSYSTLRARFQEIFCPMELRGRGTHL